MDVGDNEQTILNMGKSGHEKFSLKMRKQRRAFESVLKLETKVLSEGMGYLVITSFYNDLCKQQLSTLYLVMLNQIYVSKKYEVHHLNLIFAIHVVQLNVENHNVWLAKGTNTTQDQQSNKEKHNRQQRSKGWEVALIV